MNFMRSGCCHQCGSQSCGGACRKAAYIPRDAWPKTSASGGCPVSVDAGQLPEPKLPEKLTIEMCNDSGEWCRFTLPSNLAMMLIATPYARMAPTTVVIEQPAPEDQTQSYTTAELLECLKAIS